MNKNIIYEALFDKQKQIIIDGIQRNKFDSLKELKDIDDIFVLAVAKIKL